MLPVLLLLAAAPPEVAIVSTSGDGDFSELRFQRPGSVELAPAVARFAHVPGSTVLAALIPRTRTVVAIAQTADTRDTTWSASLVRLAAGGAAVTLADRVAISTRPLVTADGRVFVQRGRSDAITVDEIDPLTGESRTIHSFTGFTAFIAGAFEAEVLLYRVGPGGADLVAVHRDSLAVRTLVSSLAPMARDFVTDGRGLFFTTADREGWLVARVDLRTRELRTVARGAHVALLPTLLPRGPALCLGPGLGLRYLDGSPALPARSTRGFERVLSQPSGWVLALHEVPSAFPSAYALELASGRALPIAAPAGSRLDLAGALE